MASRGGQLHGSSWGFLPGRGLREWDSRGGTAASRRVGLLRTHFFIVLAIVAPLGCGKAPVTARVCTQDADCPLKAKPICDVASGQCVTNRPDAQIDGPPRDGGSETSPDGSVIPRDGTSDLLPFDIATTPQGQPCGSAPCVGTTECIDGVCCDAKTSCGPCQRCNVSGFEGDCTDVCATGCVTHVDCGAGSVCDRTNAHSTGLGTCVHPSNVTPIGTTAELSSFIASATATKWGHLTANLKGIAEEIAGKDVNLAGDGDTTLEGSSGAPILTVSGAATLVLQGVRLKLGGGGVLCNPFSPGLVPATTVIESSIVLTTGIGLEGDKCDLTVRRCTINNNSGGGLSLKSGILTVTNTLIYDNGSATSDFGGVYIGTGSTVVFKHNTVVDNAASGTTPPSIICPSDGATIETTILSGGINFYCTQVKTESAINCASTALGGYKPVNAQCKGQVAQTPTSLKLDHDNAPRFSGSPPKAALGCYEVP